MYLGSKKEHLGGVLFYWKRPEHPAFSDAGINERI